LPLLPAILKNQPEATLSLLVRLLVPKLQLENAAWKLQLPFLRIERSWSFLSRLYPFEIEATLDAA
jgi:hypothetical protein